MALFEKKKKKSKVDEALELFNSLTDDELEEFLNKADLDGDGDVDEEDTEEKKDTTEEIEEAVEDAEEKGEEPTKAEIDESVAEQEKDEDEEDSQDAEDRVDEALGEGNHLEEKTDFASMFAELKNDIRSIIAEELEKHSVATGKQEKEATKEEKADLKEIESIYNS